MGGFPMGGFPMGGFPGGDSSRFHHPAFSRLGAEVVTPPDALIEHVDLPKGQGLLLGKVREGFPAAKAGLKSHDILLELDGKPVPRDVKEFGDTLAKIKENTPVTVVVLRKGKNEALDTLETLTTSATGGSWMWEVSSELENADDYALEIQQGGENNYIGPISLTGGSDAKPSSSSASASASASSSASEESSSISVTTITSSSVSGLPTNSANGTISMTTKATRTAAGPTETETQGAPEVTENAAANLASQPLALLFGAAAAFVYLN